LPRRPPAKRMEVTRMQYGKRYTILFAAAVCGVFAILVTSSAVLLKDRQEENFRLDRMKNVLTVAGLMEPGQKLGRAEIQKIFDENIESRLIELKTGQYVTDGPDPAGYDQRKATADAATSLKAPDNRAGLVRLPKMGLVYLIKDRQGVRPFSGLLLPIEGKGLWSTLYGYLALESDLNTIRGITYYQHGETPGLGGEVENPKWKANFHGKKVYGDDGRVVFYVKKGLAGDDPHAVDGISGATITSRGVTWMLEFWMGKDGYGPYLAALKAAAGGAE